MRPPHRTDDLATARSLRTLRGAALAAAILCGVLLSADVVSAQAVPDRRMAPVPAAKIGAACYDARDRRAGVFKRDPCGRLYCGDPALRAITDVHPNYATEKHCEWQRVSWRCECVGGTSLSIKR